MCPFSVIDLDLGLKKEKLSRQTKCRKYQFDGVVGWCCDDPRTMREFIGFTAKADEPTGSVNSKGTRFSVDDCKQKLQKSMFKTKTHKLYPLDRLSFITDKNSLRFHSTTEKPDYYDRYYIG